MKTATYQDRVKAHDMLALPAVDHLFQLMGYNHFELGIEREKKKFRDVLKNRNDPQALKIRFSPDRLYSHGSKSIIICEVKSEYKKSDNFAIEFDSYLQATKYSEDGYLYAFVEINKWYSFFACSVVFGMANNMPLPKEFVISRQHSDYRSFVTRIEKEFPAVNISHRKNMSGSGTPFFLLPKQSSFMVRPLVFFGSTKDELSWPILFDHEFIRLDIHKQMYTHIYHGGHFFKIGRYPAWEPRNGSEHLEPFPVITHVLTLNSQKMGHKNIWTFTDISFDELMIKI